jgi:hypothetical protein
MASVYVDLWPLDLREAVSKKTGIITGPNPLLPHIYTENPARDA